MSRKEIRLVTPRQTQQCVTEERRGNRRRQLKYFWLWATNQSLVVLAFTATCAIVMINCGGLLLNGGNGIPFLGAVIGFLGCFSGMLQLFRLEPGYEVRDFLPRVLAKKFGW